MIILLGRYLTAYPVEDLGGLLTREDATKNVTEKSVRMKSWNVREFYKPVMNSQKQ